MIEVAEAGGLVTERMRADVHAAGPRAVGELPDLEVAVAGVVPGEIAGPVSVEVGNAGRQHWHWGGDYAAKAETDAEESCYSCGSS